MVVVVVVVMVFFVYHALDVLKFLDMARNIDGAFLIKPILFFSFLQQLHEEWVVDVDHWDYEPL